VLLSKKTVPIERAAREAAFSVTPPTWGVAKNRAVTTFQLVERLHSVPRLASQASLGFIKPQIARLVPEPSSGAGWIQ